MRWFDICLLLLSPDSAINNWLHFEAGMILGANLNNRAIPALYGGLTPRDIPSTLSHLQALTLNDQASFNAFISSRLLGNKEIAQNQNHASFLQTLTLRSLRLLNYGEFGGLVYENVTTHVINHDPLVEGNSTIEIPRIDEDGTVVGIRADIIPRRIGPVEHWKFGIELRYCPDDDTPIRLFHFHAGCHQGLRSWTIYFTPIPHVPINQPAILETEKLCSIQLWLSNDGWHATCVGIDSHRNRTIFFNDNGENRWRLRNNAWRELIINGWADGAQFQIDIERLEIDRAII